jgi:hypothetical protein
MSESQARKKSIFLSKHVPYDIVYDILTWLPMKSIMRFRCVSKSCNSIITDPIFITTHLDKANSLSNDNGYLLYMSERKYIPEKQDYSRFNELCTVVYQDQTLTEISRFEIPFTHISILGFCNGMFFLHKYRKQILYLWNPSIRKYKMLSPHFTGRYNGVVHGIAYHSQNNDFKILKIAFQGSVTGIFALLMVYTMSMDSWRRVVVSLDSNFGLFKTTI